MGLTRKRRLLLFLVCAIAVITFSNIEVSIRQGVNGVVREVKMPLYVKWIEFLSRHYEYERLVKEIVAGEGTEEGKALAILDWTRSHIKDIPQGMPRVDDHILNIIIRGYGSPEQFQDVYTTLCSYSKIPAFWSRIYTKDRKAKYTLSFVRINGKWRVFDAYYGKYFRTNNGEIASVDDIIQDRSLVGGDGIDSIKINGMPYREFYYGLTPVDKLRTLRPEKQMPLKRFIFEIKSFLKIEKKSPAPTNLP